MSVRPRSRRICGADSAFVLDHALTGDVGIELAALVVTDAGSWPAVAGAASSPKPRPVWCGNENAAIFRDDCFQRLRRQFRGKSQLVEAKTSPVRQCE